MYLLLSLSLGMVALMTGPGVVPVQAQTASSATEPEGTAAEVGIVEAAPLSYSEAVVREIRAEERLPGPVAGTYVYTQRLLVERQDTHEKIEVTVGSQYQPLNENQRLKVGARVLLTEQPREDGSLEYVVADVYRLPALTWLLVGFFVLVILVARGQGVRAMIGMAISLGLLSGFIVPEILQGANPILISLIGCSVIAVVTVYLSHGWSLHSHIALVSMMLTLVAVAALSTLAVKGVQLVGLGSEEAYYLQFGSTARVNLQGLLLGGILLGALGILDDIAVAQVSVIFQLKAVNEKLSFKELYERGLKVGKDHVASLVNTLVLAYAGANLPLFLLFTLNRDIPLWVTLNNEIIAEEIVRTLVGSMGLVLAVPVTTLLAALVVSHWQKVSKELGHRQAHSH